MKIHIFVNEVAGGWVPDDIDRFLGGGEECVVLLAEAFVRHGFKVVVYSNWDDKTIKDIEWHGVEYKPREKAVIGTNPAEEILITFKDPTPHIQGASVFRNIHWSSDVERPWTAPYLNYFVNLTEYHQSQNVFVKNSRSVIAPHGVDIASLDKNKCDRVPDTMLYCSSPDRGLVQLVKDWPSVKEHHPKLELRVAYGFRNFQANEASDPRAGTWERNLLKMMEVAGIEYLGQLSKNKIEEEYWKAQYWCLPLQSPRSELFCLNAVKARYCGCMPVVNKVGGLRSTVGDYIEYPLFANGLTNKVEEFPKATAMTWDAVVKRYWMPMIEGEL